MRDLANGFIDKQDIKFEAQNNKLVIKKKILTNRNIRRDAKKHSGLAIKNYEKELGRFLILMFFVRLKNCLIIFLTTNNMVENILFLGMLFLLVLAMTGFVVVSKNAGK